MNIKKNERSHFVIACVLQIAAIHRGDAHSISQ
jgi:hypothetical protein